MDAESQINKFREFFELNYYDKILEIASKGTEFIIIPFSHLAIFEPQLADQLLEEPEDTIRAAEYAISKFDLDIDHQIRVRFKELPASSNLIISDVRSKHLDKLLEIKGIVSQKTDVRPQVTSAKFECPSCGNIIPVLQVDTKFKEPGSCSCGRKGKFHMISKELVDAQKLVVEEDPSDLDGGEQPRRINVFLKNDLVSPISDKKTNPGSKVEIVGILKEVPISLATGGKSTRFDLMIEVNYIQPVQEEFTSLQISKEEEEKLKKLSRDPKVYDNLLNSIAPTIYGHDRIKEALVLQLFGGSRKSQDDGVTRRGDIHILLIGDPGSGKCVEGDTKILTSTGEIKRIKNLVEEKHITSLPSVQLTGKLGHSPVTRFWERETNELLELKTSSGRTLNVTKEHPLFTTFNGFIKSVEAKDLKKDSWIALPRKVDVKGELQKLDHKIKNTKRVYVYPSLLEPNLARILGYLCGDGHLQKTKTSAWISFSNINKEVNEDYYNTFYTLFDQKPTVREGEIYVTSKSLFKYLEHNFPEITRKSVKKELPGLIQKSPDNVLGEFLKGLFESDAHVNVKKRQIEYATASKNLAENVMISLLRFGVVARFKEKNKKFQNKPYRSYELIISADFTEEFKKIGFISSNKKSKLNSIAGSKNTNVDVIPNIGLILKTIRRELDLKQKDMGLTRSTYCHYEQQNRNPSRNTLQKIYTYLNNNYNTPFLDLLRTVAYSDLFWDKIKSLKKRNVSETVYDFEVIGTHNFIANGVMIHNSQLLKRMNHVAPKSRFVSGKGASGAGLCVSPDSTVLTNPGGMSKIRDIVDSNLESEEEFRPGVWKGNKANVKVQSMNKDLKLHSRKPSNIWKLQAPEYVYEILLNSGKKIELTANTKLLSTKEGSLKWIKSKDLEKNCLIASPRKLIGGDSDFSTSAFIKSNPSLLYMEEFVKELQPLLKLKFGDLRKASKQLNINENYLYHNWVKKEAKGKIRLEDLRKICDSLGIPHSKINWISLRNGKKHKIPSYNSKEFLYFAGLIAGDGDVQIRGYSTSIRFSNTSEELINHVKKVFEKLSLNYDIQKKSSARPQAIRTSSKIIGEILEGLGIPKSPKSKNLKMSDSLLHLKNELLAEYIAGLYDSDGSFVKRTTKGSNIIEFTTTSENLARQLQQTFLRYEIYTVLRKRKPSVNKKIRGKLTKYVLIISGGCIAKFKKSIPIKNSVKKEKLEQIIPSRINTNKDVIPLDLSEKLKQDLIKNKYGLKKSGWHPNLSYSSFKKLASLKGINMEVKKIAKSDLYWERIKEINVKKTNYDYVYDLTVEDSHNFVVNGILVHNTASVVKDEFLRGYALEAGALVLANKGMVCIDELDKMSKEDASAMHEALEQQSVTISKANIQATLRSETTVLAAANPKFGRFDPYEVLAKQIDLPSTLINRFDLIFPVKDLPDKEKDEKLASFILNLHKGEDDAPVPMDQNTIKFYVAYAKQRIKPKLTDEALIEIRTYFVQMRNSGNQEEKFQSIPISARQLEGLIRLSEASARTRLSTKVTKQDSKRAIDLLHHCLKLIGYDSETNTFDIDRITTGITASQRGNISVLKGIITDLESQAGKIVPIDDVVREAEIKGLDEEKTLEVIEKLKNKGDLFSPRNGFISKID